MTMKQDEMKTESISFQWDFYERAINNYSIIMRILNYFEEEESLIARVPKVFVEESIFDMCKIVKTDNGVAKEGFFSIDDTLTGLDMETVASLNDGAVSPTLMTDVFGYSLLYVYPLREDIHIFGFLVLAKKLHVDLDKRLLRELEIVCEIYNKSLLLHQSIYRRKKDTYAKTLYESALNEFPDAMFLVDKNGFICFANKRAKNEFEGGRGLLIGEKIDNILSGTSEDLYRKDSVQYGEVNYRSGDKYKLFTMKSYPVREKSEKTSYKGVVLKDVVEKKMRQEEQLIKEKMESIGMLAGGIAHDFNNLLTGVLGYASLIKNFLSNEEKLFRYAEAIESSAQRAAKLTQHLLNFSRRQRKKTGIVDLNMLLEDILFLIKESFRDVEIEKSFYEALPPIKGDEAELQNVFLNLCVNAKDAMEGVGTLKVKTERKRYIGGRDFAFVEFEDTGKGIEDELKAKIFEPYFTTKENGTNLGMGLYLVEKVIRDHGGFIELESQKGKGTKFSLYIPLPLTVVEKGVVKEEVNHIGTMKKRKVLIVDDEEVIRGFLKGVLSEEGIEICEAADGNEGIRIFTEQKESIDLVILDIIMPGIKGDEVLKTLREIQHGIKVIISSGFMSEEQRERLKEYGVDAFLDKPFRDKDVIRTIISTLSN
jgi:two-component system, cell cycle sensor histidine kinase and response regulator CckA